MDFPQIEDEPADEYSNESLFAGIFPWLFPGGIGDINDSHLAHKPKNHIWLERLIRYKDYRFQNDKMFCFYANDYCQRRLSNSNAGFFVDVVCGECPQSLDDLKDKIQDGNMTFVNKLLYFSGALKGTDSYWRRKKEELYEWMLYHIEQKNGPPTLFLTLSCAEYWWPDLLRLLMDRLLKSHDKHHHYLAHQISSGDHISCMEAINLHTGLVQEFFQLRTEAWMKTVGRKLLNIKHYWAVYEFASGRGQTHTHMLAITGDQVRTLTDYYKLRTDPDGMEKRISLMSAYARDIFNFAQPDILTSIIFSEHNVNGKFRQE